MPSKEIAIRTPQEILLEAIGDYARAETGSRQIVVSEWAIVLYTEEFQQSGNIDRAYMYLHSEKSAPHGLRGLVQKLADYVYRLR
jgi:hypothetical protein